MTAVSDDTEIMKIHEYEASVFKISHGDTRTGHRILRSSGIHPASPNAVELMSTKFITDPMKDTLSYRNDL
eukprot:7461121-Karenia_brevis.AAC.1